MQIGHTGRTRVEELVLAAVLFVIAVRTAIPIGNSAGVYGTVIAKIVVGLLIAIPAALLLVARTLKCRKRALFWAFVTFAYVGLLVPIVDWTRFGTAAAILGLALISGYLYYVTAEEIKWTPERSEPSRPPSDSV